MIQGVVVTEVDGSGGDSGGPFFWEGNTPVGPVTYLVGTHVHSTEGDYTPSGKGWFSPIDRGINQLENRFDGLDLAPCVTALCGLPATLP